jgi:predicted RNase H-like nuclease
VVQEHRRLLKPIAIKIALMSEMVSTDSQGNVSEGPDTDMVAGVDGIPGGWLAVLMQPADQQGNAKYQVRRVRSLRDLIDTAGALRVIAIDIPIGLADVYERGGRACDKLARSLLAVRRNSVFPTPIRGTLAAATWEEACIISRGSANTGMGLSKQAFGILPKIREIDELLQEHQELRSRVYEVHPELCFRRLAGAPMRHPKKSAEGRVERRLLLGNVFDLSALEQLGAAVRAPAVDLLDAAVACWTAERLYNGTAISHPDHAPLDSTGLPMVMWA